MRELKQKVDMMQVDHPLPITAYFVHRRQEKGYSREEVSRQLCISLEYIEAIEENNPSRFPERVYLLGFVRSYAVFLGLDPEECLRRFKEEVLQEEGVMTFSLPEPLSSESLPDRKTLYFSLLALILLLGFGVYKFWPSSKPPTIIKMPPPPLSLDSPPSSLEGRKQKEHGPSSSLSTPPADELSIKEPDLDLSGLVESSEEVSGSQDSQDSQDSQEKKKPEHVLTSEDSSALPKVVSLTEPENFEKEKPFPANPPSLSSLSPSFSGAPSSLVFEFSEPTWVSLKDSFGQVILEKIFQKGEKYVLNQSKGWFLHTGNAGGMMIRVETTDPKTGDFLSFVQPLGRPGEVLKDISLDPQHMATYLSPKKNP